MHLSSQLRRLHQSNTPVRVAVIGAGKFGSMYLAQAAATPGIHIAAIVDLDPQRVRRSLPRIGWETDRFGAATLQRALQEGSTFLTDRFEPVITHGDIDLVIEATGSVTAAVEHVVAAIDAGKHVVMVSVEADAVVGPMLSRRAEEAGVVYSLAFGDQPALICEMVDWARTCGFDVVCAGKGTKYLPQYHQSTPDTIWDYYGFTEEQVRSGDYNARMFNSFLDGTKSAIEMAAVSNATGLQPQECGLSFPPCPTPRLPEICVPQSAGGVLQHAGTVEVVSSLWRDGSEIEQDLRWGVYVTLETDNDYVKRCFHEYGALTEPSGRYAALYRPTHYIGLELGYSVARAALSGEATGTPREFNADVAAVAKRDLAAGERLDGEGGYTVYGQLMKSRASLSLRALPLGLAADVPLIHPVKAGQVVTWEDVESVRSGTALDLRRQLERLTS